VATTAPDPALEVRHHNPEGVHRNPAFSQAVSVRSSHTVVYVGGQNAVTAAGAVIGRGDVAAQLHQVFENLVLVLDSAGARLEHVVSWNVRLTVGQPLAAAFQVFRERWGNRSNPPAISLSFVAGLSHPDFLVELDAVAVVPG
jgi:enamine deaminase RidA (YjgF/YER057c/UK114 family)